MKATFRRAKLYTGGLSIVDRGYTKPNLLDAVAASGAFSQDYYGGAAPNTVPAGAALAGDLDTGKLWVHLNGEWLDTGIMVSL